MRVQRASGLFALVVVATTLAAAPVRSQNTPDPQAAGSSAPNPTAQSVTEQQLLQQQRKIRGRITIPDPKQAILEQPQGRTYQTFHERILPWIGGSAIVGAIIALGAFYFIHGPIRLHSRLTGRKVNRFTWLERFTHWLTAASFIVLALTGLNYFLGKRLLLPLLGPQAFATWSQWAKVAHDAFAWPFMLGVVLMIVLWLRDNLPDRYDVEWLKRFGGFLSGEQVPARRFNAGQKLVFWAVTVGGFVLTGSGVVLLFPMPTTDVNAIQVAQYVHAIAAVAMIALILAHIYIGTIGMQEAFEAMYSGEVDLAWAKEHHRIWVEEEQAPTPEGPQLGKNAIPAE
jgi:formate dehydrogenase subunit gamma